MVYATTFPKDATEYQQFVAYLQDGTFPEDVLRKHQWSFKRKMANWRLINDALFYCGEDKPPRQFVPKWDQDLRASLLKQFHENDRHINADDSFDKIAVHHIGFTRKEVREYVRECATCNRTSSIKEKTI